jgi:ELWxxDGT repeat protein
LLGFVGVLAAAIACRRWRRAGKNGRRIAVLHQQPLGIERLEDRRLLSVDLQLLKDLNASPNTDGSAPAGIVDVSGVAFFRATTGTTGEELWKSDGTEAGTVRVKDIRVESSSPRYLTNVGGTLYFRAANGNSGGG